MKKRRRTRINFRLIGIFLGVFVVIGVGIYGAHRYQVSRQAGSIRDEALAFEKAGKLAEAADAWRRFISVKPENLEAKAIYAALLDKVATTPKEKVTVLEELESVLRLDAERLPLRRRAMSLAMELAPLGGAKYEDVRRHIDILLKDAEDAVLRDLQGQTFEAESRFDEARKSYETALTFNPKAIDTSLRLAKMLVEKQKNVSDATKVLDEMVKADPKSARAFLKRAEFRFRYDIPGAAEDLADARELAPADADVIVARITADEATMKPDALIAEIERGIKLHNKDIRLYRLLIKQTVKIKRVPDAIAALRGALDKEIPVEGDERVAQIELRLLLADLLQGTDKPDEASPFIAEIREIKEISPDMSSVLDYLEAKNLILKKEWIAAVAKLKDVVPRLRNTPDLQRQAYIALGSSCTQIGDNDGRRNAFREAGKVGTDDPIWVTSHMELAAAQLALGQPDEALAEYQRVKANAPAAAPVASVIIANLLLNKELAVTPAKRVWAPVEKALSDAQKLAPGSADLPLIRATVLMVKGQKNEARALIEDLRNRTPGRIEPWTALCVMAGREGRFKDAETLIGEMDKQFGDRVEVRLARARLLIERDRGAAAAQLKTLLKDVSAYNDQQKVALFSGIVDSYFRIEAVKEAQALWASLVQTHPDNLNLWTTAFDLAIVNDDDAAMKRALDNIHRIEGSGGTLGNLGEVFTIIRLKKRGEQASLDTARARLADVLVKRPNSSRVALAQAEIESIEGKNVSAANNYLRALSLGDKNPYVLRKTLSLLYQQERFTEADQQLRGLADSGGLPDDLKPLASELASRTQDFARALELAREPIAAGSQKSSDYLWLGKVLAGAARQAEAKSKLEESRGFNEEAEKVIRKALGLPGDNNPALVSLVQFLVAVKQIDKAEATLKENQAKAPDRVSPLTVALCHHALGHADQARSEFKALLAAKPDDSLILRGAAELELKEGRLKAAEPLLTKLSELKTATPRDAEWARQALSLSLAAAGRFKDSERALKILGITAAGDDQSLSLEDRRTNAKVLSLQPNPALRDKAIEILEHFVAERSANDSDRFLLAQLHDFKGEWSKAREIILQLLAVDKPQPDFLVYFADRLLIRGEFGEAPAIIAALEKTEPNTYRTVALKARLLNAQGKKRSALPIVESYLKRNGGPKETAFAADLLDKLQLPVEAEKLYRRLAEKQGDAKSILDLAMFLGRQGRLDDAISICGEAEGKAPATEISAALLKIVFATKPDAHQAQTVELRLKREIEKNPNTPAIEYDLANLYILLTRYKDAELIYRKHCREDASQSFALNNLAWLLALHGGGGAGGVEALELINRAIKIEGKRPELLDTRGVIYINMKKFEEAKADLTDSLANHPRPETFLHLSKVYLKLGDKKAASDALDKARSAGLQMESLDEADRSDYGDLVKVFTQN